MVNSVPGLVADRPPALRTKTLTRPGARAGTTTVMVVPSTTVKVVAQVSGPNRTPVAPPKPEPVSVVPEWDDDERLAFEKEVLGFYISGHPLARYASVAESLGITTTSDLAGKTPGSRVLLFGQVAAVKETSTKSGSRMAFATLEDMNGTVEVTIFPEPFKAAAEHLRSREPLLIRGRLDDSDKGRVVLAEDVRPLAYALQEAATRSTPAGEPSALRIRVRAGDDADRLISTVKALCGAHRGPVPRSESANMDRIL